jgi:hypothetical protein
MIFYHVTPKSNVPSIDRDGLIPQCGDGCVGLNKDRAGVYFWRHENQGQSYAATVKGALVTVEIPGGWVGSLQRDNEYFEDETEAWVFPHPVPRSWIISIQKAKPAWRKINVWQ